MNQTIICLQNDNKQMIFNIDSLEKNKKQMSKFIE